MILKGEVYRYLCYFILCVIMIIDFVLGNDSLNLVWVFVIDYVIEYVKYKDFVILSRIL